MKVSARFLLLVLTAAILPAIPAFAQAGFTLLGTHPDAAAQPTVVGRRLATLMPFNGKIYAGYGDYGANTGPIAVRPFDPTTGQFGDVKVYARTEALYIYRNINGTLYSPHIDPTGSMGGYAQGDAAGAGEVWADHRPVSTLHMFDLATYTGSDLWMVGAAGSNARAWRSLDNGGTWEVALTVPAPSGGSGDFARFYGAGVLKGKMYLQPTGWQSPYNTHSMVYDGTSWTEGPNLVPTGNGFVWHPETFARQIVYQNYHGALYSTYLYRFNGHHASRIRVRGGSTWYYDFFVDDDVLYALSSNGVVQYTTNLHKWTTLTTAPSTARSLAVLGNTLYIGTSDSCLYRYDQAIFAAGDANHDDVVDVGDLGILGAHYGTAGATWQTGDFNGDGVVNVADLGVLGAHYGQASGRPWYIDDSDDPSDNDVADALSGLDSGTAAAPEPASAILVMVGGVGVVARRRRRQPPSA